MSAMTSQALFTISTQLAQSLQLKSFSNPSSNKAHHLSVEEQTAISGLLQNKCLLINLLTEIDTPPIEVLWYPTSE